MPSIEIPQQTKNQDGTVTINARGESIEKSENVNGDTGSSIYNEGQNLYVKATKTSEPALLTPTSTTSGIPSYNCVDHTTGPYSLKLDGFTADIIVGHISKIPSFNFNA